MPATHPNSLHQRTISNFSSHHGHHVSVASTDEDLFSSITGLDDLVGEEDDLSFDDGFDGDDLGSNKNSTGASKRKIRAASTAEKKATHNAVERARRESLNARFLVLADMLPGMTQVKRASKAAIVNKSIDLITDMQLAEARMSKENASLKAELDALRLRLNGNEMSSSALSQPASSTIASVQQQQQQHQQQQALFAGMPHHLQMQAAVAAAAAAGMPMMHNMPPNAAAAAAMASAAAMQAHHHHAAQAQAQAQVQAQAQQAHMNMNNMNAQAHAQVQAAQAQAQAQAAHAHLQAQFNAAAAAAAASSTTTSATPSADMGHQLFPGIFSGLFTNNATPGTFDALESARSESGSPASLGGASTHSTASHPFSHGLFDLPPMTGFSTDGNGNNNLNGSPGSISFASPPGTVASLAGSERTAGTSQAGGTATSSASGGALTHNTAPSPASSNGIPTPSNNAYSPLGLPTLSTATPQLSHASSTSNSNSNSNNVTGMDPAIAAFDGSADAAYLAAQFAPNDLAKAQQELQAFIAYQHRMAFGGGDSSSSASQHNSSSSQQMQQQQQQQPPTPTLEHGHRSSSVSLSQQQQMSPTLYTPSGSAFTFPPQQQQQQQQHHHQQQQQQMSYPAAAIAGMCGPQAAQASMAGVPAWQMMMAQHQAMVAAYGQQPHF